MKREARKKPEWGLETLLVSKRVKKMKRAILLGWLSIRVHHRKCHIQSHRMKKVHFELDMVVHTCNPAIRRLRQGIKVMHLQSIFKLTSLFSLWSQGSEAAPLLPLSSAVQGHLRKDLRSSDLRDGRKLTSTVKTQLKKKKNLTKMSRPCAMTQDS
jgi:hypothetical protein